MSEQKRVLLITADIAGGLRKHLLDILFNVSREKVHFGLAADFENGDAGFKVQEGKLAAVCGDRLLRLNVPKKPALVDLTNIFRLVKFARKHRFDAIHGHAAKGGLYARVVGVLAGVPAFYTPHGGSLHACYGWPQRLLYRSIEYCLSFITHQIVFESNYSAQAFLERIRPLRPCCYLVNYNGIDFPDNILGRDRRGECLRLCAIGILRPIKGHDVLIDAMFLLKVREINARLDIFGEGESREDLEKQVMRLGVDVTFKGDVPDAAKYLSDYDIVVQPSRFESFGYVLLEAMALGVPVVATRVGGMVEIIDQGRNGLLFENEDPISLADALETLYREPKLARKITAEGRQTVKNKFSVDRMISKIESLYQAVE